MDFTALFVDVDDFWQTFEQKYQPHLIQSLNETQVTRLYQQILTLGQVLNQLAKYFGTTF